MVLFVKDKRLQILSPSQFGQVDFIYTDFAEAFEGVQHDDLFPKLSN